MILRAPTGRTGRGFGLAALGFMLALLVLFVRDQWGHVGSGEPLPLVLGAGAIVCGLVGAVSSLRAIVRGRGDARWRGVAGLLLSLPALLLAAWVALILYLLFTVGFD